MLIFFIIFENRLISYLLFKFEVEFHQTEQPASVGDLQGYVTIMTSCQSYGLINPNIIAYVYIVGMQSKCKYIIMYVIFCMR